MASKSRNSHEWFDCNGLKNPLKKNLPPWRAGKASVESRAVISHPPDSEKSFMCAVRFLLQFQDSIIFWLVFHNQTQKTEKRFTQIDLKFLSWNQLRLMRMVKMHINILGTIHPYRAGGLATFNERLAREFIAQGHHVVVYTFSLQYPSFLFPGKTQMSDEPAPTDLDIRIKINSINPFNWWKVGRQIRRLAPDLVVMKFWIPFMGPCLGTIARLIRKNKKTKVISIVDNMIPHEKRFGDMTLIRYFARSVDGFIAMSESVKSDIESFKTNKPVAFAAHPIYDTFGMAYEKAEAKRLLGLDPDTHYLLFFGFIRDYKGLDIAIEAMADPRIRTKKVKLIVAGEFYTNSKPYLQRIDELGIHDSLVLHTDFIKNTDVGKYFSAADMIVQPYKEATQSGVTQIAYNYHKPMLVTNVGGLPEIVPHGRVGYVVEVSPLAIADAIVDFYEHDREEAMIAEVIKDKPKFLWDHFADKIHELANQLNRP